MDDYLDGGDGGGGGWEGDVMYEGGSEGVVAWGALSQGEEERRLRTVKEALGSVMTKHGSDGSAKTKPKGGGGGGRGGGRRGASAPDAMKIVMTKSGGYSGVAAGHEGQKGGGNRRGAGGR